MRYEHTDRYVEVKGYPFSEQTLNSSQKLCCHPSQRLVTTAAHNPPVRQLHHAGHPVCVDPVVRPTRRFSRSRQLLPNTVGSFGLDVSRYRPRSSVVRGGSCFVLCCLTPCREAIHRPLNNICNIGHSICEISVTRSVNNRELSYIQ